MQSSTNYSQTAVRFSELPPEILLCIASFVDPETCLSLLQVSRLSSTFLVLITLLDLPPPSFTRALADILD